MNPLSGAAVAPLLSGREWKPAYETEDGDLVELFYNPALACAKSYDRMTGYFSANALALAARGVAGMIANAGPMRFEENPTSAAPAGGKGVCWLANSPEGKRMILQTEDGPQEVDSLNQPIDTLQRVGAPSASPGDDAQVVV